MTMQNSKRGFLKGNILIEIIKDSLKENILVKRVLLPLLLILAGCTSFPGRTPLDTYTNDYRAGKYHQAAVQISLFLREHPYTPQKEEAVYYLAKCYYEMRNYYLAAQTFQDYLTNWPNGRWANEAYGFLSSINDKLQKDTYSKQELEEEYQRLAFAYKEILGKKIPKDKIYLEIGNIYWEQGKDEKAREAYSKAIATNPSLRTRSWLIKRIQALQRGEKGLKPQITVFNEHLQDIEEVIKSKIRIEDNAGVEEYREAEYVLGKATVISGEVENRGNEGVLHLRILITAYDFYRRVLNSSYAYIGRLDPGAVSSFSVTVKNISKDQIHQVTYKPIFE